MDSAPSLATLEHGPADAGGSVIWLHGLGADGHDFEPLVPELQRGDLRFVFPHAPLRRVTVNNGMRMRAWYDIASVEIDAREDAAGIRESAAAVERLIAAEVGRGVPARRIVLAGFSQGGAIALHTGVRHGDSLAGLLALSCYLPLRGRLAEEARPETRGVPVLMCHGEADPIVPPRLGEVSRDLLREQGYRVDWRTYPMPHTLVARELEDIRAWLDAVLPS